MKHYDTFWAIPKEVMAMKKLSLQARMIYGILYTRMNGENEAWPGQGSIARDLGIGERSVRRYLDELKDSDLIVVTRRGLGRSNTYSIPANLAAQDRPTVAAQDRTDVSAPSMKRTDRKEQDEYAPGGAVVGALIDLFQGVNPSWRTLFARGNQREAVKRMLKAHGEEKLRAIVEFLPKNNMAPYAPKITTPIQLEERMGTMAAFWQQEKAKGGKNQVVTI